MLRQEPLCLQKPSQTGHRAETVEVADRSDELVGATGTQHRRLVVATRTELPAVTSSQEAKRSPGSVLG